jgi:hypothetical protein
VCTACSAAALSEVYIRTVSDLNVEQVIGYLERLRLDIFTAMSVKSVVDCRLVMSRCRESVVVWH